LDENELDNRILRDFAKYINKSFKNCLDELLTKTLIPVVVGLSGISPERKVHDITKTERKTLVRLLKNLELTVTGTAGFDEAVITRGGVCVKEVDPSTMESKLVRGLYFVGEVLDLDAYTGGYNLQIAFATGYLAATATSE
jgi:predicted Rossmann fold flavoprotein